jgi:hypothetical protein
MITQDATFIGIDVHKRYSVHHAVDATGADLGKGRIEHHSEHFRVKDVSRGAYMTINRKITCLCSN